MNFLGSLLRDWLRSLHPPAKSRRWHRTGHVEWRIVELYPAGYARWGVYQEEVDLDSAPSALVTRWQSTLVPQRIELTRPLADPASALHSTELSW